MLNDDNSVCLEANVAAVPLNAAHMVYVLSHRRLFI